MTRCVDIGREAHGDSTKWHHTAIGRTVVSVLMHSFATTGCDR
jgi:hypothetical protein